MASSAQLLEWPAPSAHYKVRQRGGQPQIIDAAPGTPQSAIVVLGRMRVGQVTAFDFYYESDLFRFRQRLYNHRHAGSPHHYITRAHGRLVMVMRVA